MRPGLLTPPLFLLLSLPFSLFDLPLDPLLLLPLPLFLLDSLLVLPFYALLLVPRLPLHAELLFLVLVLLLSLHLEDLLSLLLPRLSNLTAHTLVLRSDRLVDEEGRDVGEKEGHDGRADKREVDPDETVHVGHALLIEATQPTGAFRI